MTPGGEQSGTMDKANEAQIKRLDEELMKLQRGHMPCHWQTQPEQFVFARQPEQIVFATCISMPWTQTPENVLAILDRTMAVLEETVCDRGGGGIATCNMADIHGDWWGGGALLALGRVIWWLFLRHWNFLRVQWRILCLHANEIDLRVPSYHDHISIADE